MGRHGMFAAFCTTEDLTKALEKVNEKYDGNINFSGTCDLDSCLFFLVCKDSKGPGANLFKFSGYELGRNKNQSKPISTACVHVYKDFFDILFESNAEAIVYDYGTKICKDEPYCKEEEWCTCLEKEKENKDD